MNNNRWCCGTNEETKHVHCNRITLVVILIINFAMTIGLVTLLLKFAVFAPTTNTTTEATTITTTQQPGKNFNR